MCAIIDSRNIYGAIELVSLSAIRRCPLFRVSAIREFLKYGMYGKKAVGT